MAMGEPIAGGAQGLSPKKSRLGLAPNNQSATLCMSALGH
jgi:hypothetical protein